jgi:hypothetical protein
VKLSATIARETNSFLEQMVSRGQAANLAEALDRAISSIRKIENRQRLADASTRYFSKLDSEAIIGENALARDMTAAAGTIDLDKEI